MPLDAARPAARSQVEHRIATSTAVGNARVKKMQERDALLQGIVNVSLGWPYARATTGISHTVPLSLVYT